MRSGKTWTREEIEYLQDNYGLLSYGTIAKNLNRSISAVNVKARILKLGSFLENGDYVTFNQLILALGGEKLSGSGYKMISWVKNRDFPMHKKRVNQCSFKIVYIHEFWEWAEKNRDLLDFSRFEENTLGAEPEWVKKKRKLDFERNRKYKSTPWTKLEDRELIRLVKMKKYSYDQLSKMICRTNGAIQRRLCDLKVVERPIKADNHTLWTQEQKKRLGELIKQGYKYDIIAEEIGKSSKSVRGFVFRHYMTENIDKVRIYIGSGEFGDNMPPKRIKDFKAMNTEERTEVRDLLSRLAAVVDSELREAIRQQGWSEWSDICQNYCRGCIEKGFHCDECIDYKRIEPQNCRMCGKTFYERKENTYCIQCRTQRKKSYLRKKMILNNRMRA